MVDIEIFDPNVPFLYDCITFCFLHLLFYELQTSQINEIVIHFHQKESTHYQEGQISYYINNEDTVEADKFVNISTIPLGSSQELCGSAQRLLKNDDNEVLEDVSSAFDLRFYLFNKLMILLLDEMDHVAVCNYFCILTFGVELLASSKL